MGLHAISLFSGAGGLDLAARWAGVRTVCYVENDRYCQAVLMSRMLDGTLDHAPIWDDVRGFNGKAWRAKVDCIFGGFPCQDLSVAGKRAGIVKGTRSSLWFEFARIIGEVRPQFVLVENVPGLIFSGGIGSVLVSLAEMGYDAGWYTLSAAAVGAPHLRERIWIIANATSPGRRKDGAGKLGRQENAMADSERSERWAKPQGWQHERHGHDAGRQETAGGSRECCQDVAHAEDDQQPRRGGPRKRRERSTNGGEKFCHASVSGLPHWVYEALGTGQEGAEVLQPQRPDWWAVEPLLGRMAHGLANRVDCLRALGNGVVPQQATPAFEKIIEMSRS